MSRNTENMESTQNRERGNVSRENKRAGKGRLLRGVCVFLLVAALGVGGVYFMTSANPFRSVVLSDGDVSKTGSMTVASAQMSTAAVSPTAAPTTAAKAPAGTSAPSGVAGAVSLENAAKPLWIHVSVAKQNVTVYDAKNRVVESFVCSTGLPGSDTPKGKYTIHERGKSFFSQSLQEGAYYWTQFQGDFLFHSVPFDKNKKIMDAEAAKLGTKASHGCVRLSIDNAKWIYDNIPRGTVVVIE